MKSLLQNRWVKWTGLCLLTFSFLIPSGLALAKKDKKQKNQAAAPAYTNPRLQNLSADDKRQFDALSDDQQQKIKEGKIDLGFNAWMVKLALGEPFYATEHHPVFVDYEQVWLYTKPDVQQDVTEEQIIDPTNNWPTIHRKIKKKTCTVGDFFVLWDRGVVNKIDPTNDKKVYGSCTVEEQEAFLPIVNGKPVEPIAKPFN